MGCQCLTWQYALASLLIVKAAILQGSVKPVEDCRMSQGAGGPRPITELGHLQLLARGPRLVSRVLAILKEYRG